MGGGSLGAVILLSLHFRPVPGVGRLGISRGTGTPSSCALLLSLVQEAPGQDPLPATQTAGVLLREAAGASLEPVPLPEHSLLLHEHWLPI